MALVARQPDDVFAAIEARQSARPNPYVRQEAKMDGFPCIECDRTFASEHARKIHAARAHQAPKPKPAPKTADRDATPVEPKSPLTQLHEAGKRLGALAESLDVREAPKETDLQAELLIALLGQVTFLLAAGSFEESQQMLDALDRAIELAKQIAQA